jgi:hypothetical protein
MDEAPHAEQALPKYTLSRVDVAKQLRVSTSTVRRMEFDRLHPRQDARGIWRFDVEEVQALELLTQPQQRRTARRRRHCRRNRGRMAVRMFRLFAAHKTLPQIVLATRQPPDIVRALYHEWRTSLEDAERDRRRDAD